MKQKCFLIQEIVLIISQSTTGKIWDIFIIKILYIGSSRVAKYQNNIFTLSKYGGKGEINIIKKIPATLDFGYLIINDFTSNHNWLSCASLSIGCLEFQLRDSNGKIIPLHGSNVSFAIVFAKDIEGSN